MRLMVVRRAVGHSGRHGRVADAELEEVLRGQEACVDDFGGNSESSGFFFIFITVIIRYYKCFSYLI